MFENKKFWFGWTFLCIAVISLLVIPNSYPISKTFKRYPALDPSCVLSLPFYQYGAEQTKIWDQSGKNSHGTITGATPATYPMLSGLELVNNGGFNSDVTGWTAINCTFGNPVDGVPPNCLQIIRSSGTSQSASQTLSLINGKTYKLSGWVKSWTSGDESFQFNIGSSAYAQVAGGSTIQWLYYELIFIADNTQADWQNIYLVKNSATVGSMRFDTISVQQVMGYQGLGWGFNGTNQYITHPSLNLGTVHTLHYWIANKFPNTGGVVHGGAANYHGLRVTDSQVGYNCGTTEVLVNCNTFFQGFGFSYLQKSLFSIVRNGTSVTFYQNGVQLGTTQTLLANNALTLTNIGDYSSGASYYQGVIGDILIFNRALSAVEIRNYYEMARGRYGQ